MTTAQVSRPVLFVDAEELQYAKEGDFAYYWEASQLGLAPGYWPEQLATNLGNGQPFVISSVDSKTGTRIYKQDLGCLFLHLLND